MHKIKYIDFFKWKVIKTPDINLTPTCAPTDTSVPTVTRLYHIIYI